MLTSIFFIFTGAAVFATLAMFTRQSLLIAYIALGMVIGPYSLGWIHDATLIKQTSDIGIIFLLFLLGLNLQPHYLLQTLRSTTIVAVVSSLGFALVGFIVGRSFGYNLTESLIIGASLMFSSTLIGLKLLPTTVLHHQHTGNLMISVLLLQDLIAIFLLVIINGTRDGINIFELGAIFGGLPCLIVLTFLFERYILRRLLARFDRIKEFIFLVAIGWCLGLAELTEYLKLSLECGAFIAGVALAEGPIALYIAESLKPLRDFFLIMFFFSIGANFNFAYLPQIIVPALVLSTLLLLLKPWAFARLLRLNKELPKVAREVGMRLGQGSEFSLLLAYLAGQEELKLISDPTSYLIQATTIITFVVSCYTVVWRYPTPIAFNEDLRRD